MGEVRGDGRRSTHLGSVLALELCFELVDPHFLASRFMLPLAREGT